MAIHAYKAVQEHEFSENKCFLCGVSLTNENKSDEHVFPKWLQHQFNLWNKTIYLINGTTIQYKNLKIPCCTSCNNGPLAEMEDKVSVAVKRGYREFSKLERKDIALWLAKLFYGVLYRELFLPLDRKKPNNERIVSEERIRGYQLIHFFLQSVRIPVKMESFETGYPVTIYLFKVQKLKCNDYNFDFRDDINLKTIYARIGDIGILAAFDAGAQAVEGEEYFGRYLQKKLHPLQLEELGANLFYKASLLDRNPKVLIKETESEITIHHLPIAGLSMKSVFREWAEEDYIQILSTFTGAPVEFICPNESQIMTWLTNQNGEFTSIDLKNNPYRGYK